MKEIPSDNAKEASENTAWDQPVIKLIIDVGLILGECSLGKSFLFVKFFLIRVSPS